jgi:hypothetical protein
MNGSLPSRPDPETISRYITTTFPDVDVVSIDGMRFFSLDPQKHWPNFATLVWSDDADKVSDLSRPGVFRLSMGLDRSSYERIAKGAGREPDYSALDRVLPHPDYAKQRWVAILNPSESTFEEVVVPLLHEAHGRLAAQRARHPRRA